MTDAASQFVSSKASVRANNPAGDADTDAARLAYAAFEGLCGASCMAAEPILRAEAVQQRARAVGQLRQALTLLEAA